MERLYGAFGRNLKKARLDADLTQRDVAQRVGLQRTSITNIERGMQHISLHQLYLLASAVGVSPVALLPNEARELEELVPAKALRGLDADEEALGFAVQVLSKNQRVSASATASPATDE